MNKEIKTIVFDYGGVISLFQDIKKVKKICRILGINKEEFHSIYQKVRQDYDSGIISAKEYWNILINNFQNLKKITDRDIKKIINYDISSWSKINKETIITIEKLYKKKIKLAILSNMTIDTLKYINKKSKWIKYFDCKVFSCNERKCKPDEEIYKIILNRLSEKPENILFIDDSITNIISAEKLGINVIHFKNNIELIKEMNKKYNISF